MFVKMMSPQVIEDENRQSIDKTQEPPDKCGGSKRLFAESGRATGRDFDSLARSSASILVRTDMKDFKRILFINSFVSLHSAKYQIKPALPLKNGCKVL